LLDAYLPTLAVGSATNPFSFNLNQYARGNPANFADETGLDIQFHWKRNTWIGKENLLKELGLVGQIVDILSDLPYKRPGRLSKEGKFVNCATQCVSFARMLLSIFVDDSFQPRRLGAGTTPGTVFGKLVASNLQKSELKNLDTNTLYALQSKTLKGQAKHVSLLTYSEWLESWITIESTTRVKGRLLSGSTGANIYRLDDVRAKKRGFDVYKIGPKYRAPIPGLEDREFY
jgi:hypothetical protein